MWIEMVIIIVYVQFIRSRPARALWIEIVLHRSQIMRRKVEAREGLVD